MSKPSMSVLWEKYHQAIQTHASIHKQWMNTSVFTPENKELLKRMYEASRDCDRARFDYDQARAKNTPEP